jgi:hypothetical protein
MPAYKFYLLFILPNLSKKKKKIENSAAARWCLEVCSPYSTDRNEYKKTCPIFLLFLIVYGINGLLKLTKTVIHVYQCSPGSVVLGETNSMFSVGHWDDMKHLGRGGQQICDSIINFCLTKGERTRAQKIPKFA